MIEFTVYGRPVPQGSAKGFAYQDKESGKWRSAVTHDSGKVKPWRQEISTAAFGLTLPADWSAHQDRKVGVTVWLAFYLARPASLAKKFWLLTTKPDQDKLARAVNDALTGILYVDDSQIVESHVRKDYGQPERVEIRLEELKRLPGPVGELFEAARKAYA